MKKEKLRFLALGFFISALILTVFQLVFPSTTAEDDKAEETVAASNDYQQQYESLLVEHESLLKQQQNQSEQDITAEDESSLEEEIILEDESSEEVVEAETPVPTPSNTPIVFLVHEGQPSSVVLQNLLEAGLIEEIDTAEEYLVDRDLLTKIQYGSYTLSKDMSEAEILNTITAQ